MAEWTLPGGFVSVYTRSSGDARYTGLIARGYSLASNTVLDTNGITRFGVRQRIPQAFWDNGGSPNRLVARLTVLFRDTDIFFGSSISTGSGWRFGAVMAVTPASSLADPELTPTPADICSSSSAMFYRSSTTRSTQGTLTVDRIPGPQPHNLTPGEKYWVLVYPAYWSSTAAWNGGAAVGIPWGINNLVDTYENARGVSLWTARTPAAPVITSPATPLITVAPGASFTLSYTPQSADAITSYPDDIAKTDALDIAGAEAQYSALPSPDNPDPEWLNLPVRDNFGSAQGVSWHIEGSDLNSTSGAQSLWDEQSLEVRCGGGGPGNGEGYLPPGKWRVRVRTMTYGHPYRLVYETPGPPPSAWRPGIGPLGTNIGGWTNTGDPWPSKNQTPGGYTARYRSAWSEPFTVLVPAPVPPPLVKRPVGGVAIPANKNVIYEWQYRNAQYPPRPQARRSIQLREVGEPVWQDLLLNDVSADQTYVDPAGGTVVPYTSGKMYEWRIAAAPSMSAVPDPGFEQGTLGDWSASVSSGAVTFVNVSGTGSEVYDGSRCAKVTFTGAPTSLYLRRPARVTPGASYTFTVRCRRIGGSGFTADLRIFWKDEDDVLIATHSGTSVTVGTGWSLVTVSGTVPAGSDPSTSHGGLYCFSPPAGVEVRMDACSFTTSGPIYEPSEFSEVGQFWITEGPGTGSVIPAPGETIDGATLGCGKHRVFIYRRGGKRRVGELTGLSSVGWGRVRDDISPAKIVVSDWSVDCGNLLSKLQTWAYELVIYRDNGYSNERVWEGPITKLTYETDKVTIDAKDVMAYAYRRIIKRAMNDGGWGSSGVSIIDRAETILLDTLGPDDPNVLGYLTPLRQDDDVKQYRNLPAYSRTAFEEIDDMAANAGLDYAAVGRRIMLWGTKHRIGTLPEFRDEHLGAPPIVSEYGMSLANRYVVSDGNGVWGEAVRLKYDHLFDPGYDDVYGLVEMLSSSWASDSAGDTGTYTEAGKAKIRQSFAEASERSIADRYPPPVVVRIPDNTSLSPDTPVTIQQLAPGVAIPLRSVGTLRQVRGLQKLDSVTVEEVAGTETITITLSSFSRDDGGEDPGEGE